MKHCFLWQSRGNRSERSSLANDKTLYVLDAFLIENGEIIEQQNHYDSRAATEGAAFGTGAS